MQADGELPWRGLTGDQMRLHRITFVAGLAVGYVLGAQAGRERYEQLRRLARKAADSPAMQQTAGALQAQASATARSAKNKAMSSMRGRSSKANARRGGATEDGAAADGSSPGVRGDGAAPTGRHEDNRPFMPVNGDFGDHDVMP
jgi:hypothetical protein